MAEEKFKCEECGETFDSERGLHIHQSRSHGKGSEQNNPKKEGNELNEMPFGIRSILLGVFALGLFVGFSTGIVFSQLTNLNSNVEISGESKNSNLVTLENEEYPYGDLEAGIGNRDRAFGNVTFQLEGEPYIGSPDAEAVAVSFEDFECPFCKRYNEGAYPQIVENYVKTGEVQYFYKNLVLQRLHPWAKPAALASECALNQDAETFWTFKKGFFDNQKKLGNAHQNGKFDESMYKWAEQTGLDTEQFKQCYDSKEEMKEVQNDKRQASTIGAKATPTIFINDQKLEGAQPYSQFESAIENALN